MQSAGENQAGVERWCEAQVHHWASSRPVDSDCAGTQEWREWQAMSFRFAKSARAPGAWRHSWRALLVAAAFVPAVSGANTPDLDAKVARSLGLMAGTNGPTIRLDYTRGEGGGNPVAAFMYFVPLISPEPVSSVTSPASTQSARVVSATRKVGASSFVVVCDFEFLGNGSQQSIIDLSEQIRRHEQKLKAGEPLSRQLSSITVEGPGSGRVEVEGTLSNGVEAVTEVRLRFNTHGKPSPVSIGLCDVRYAAGEYQRANEIVARVNTLTFRRKAGPPKMEVTVAAVKNKGAGNGFWQNFKGSLKGAAVNLLIDPLTVEAIGHEAMLDFGRALTAGDQAFTFPRARNLKESAVGETGR